MTPLTVYVEGIGLWSRELADFDALRALLKGETPAPNTAVPAASLLPANERRRAPESVRLAAEVAGQALAASGRDAAATACVFASAHGDQTITDDICATLARAPTELSPTRFHHSVHNAPAGYWTIATGCHAPSSAVCAGAHTFAAALLEAASQALAEQRAVLLVCSDIAGRGPLLAMTACTQPFGCALVLTPQVTAAAQARLQLELAPDRAPPSPTPTVLAALTSGNPSAAALPLLALLAGTHGRCRLGVSATRDLRVAVDAAT